MSFIYKREIIDGVSSSRKIFGIPVYQRTDTEEVTVKKYFLGIWKTETYRDRKRYYLFGGCVGEKNYISVKEFRALLEEYKNTAAQLNSAAKQSMVFNSMKNELNKCYAETANLKNLIQCQGLHKATFGPYRNAFRGREVVLVASGPTSAYYTPIEGAIHVGCNNACLLENVKLDYLFCQDFYMDDEKRELIVNYRPGQCKKFFGRIPDNRMEACMRTKEASHVRRIPRHFVDEAEASEYYVYDLLQNRIAYDIEREPLVADSVANAAFQFILHCHPDRIYLVGCDCSSGYFYESKVQFDNSIMISKWKKLKEYADSLYPDIEIISVNPVGLKGVFKDEYDEVYLIKNR